MKTGIKSCRLGLLAGAAMLAFISSSFAVDHDGWGTDGGPGNPVLSNSTTIGVTLGTQSLKSVNPQGGFWGPSTGNLVTNHLSAAQNAVALSLDLTLIGTELSGDGSAFSGFAQSNELALVLFSNPGGTLPAGINAFIQRNFAAGGATDSKNHAGQWAGDNGTRTITWNLSNFTFNDPTTGTAKTWGQLLIDHPDIQDAKIAFVEQFGGGVAPGAFYFDNVLLRDARGLATNIGNFEPVPEPASLVLLGLAVPVLVAIARQRRKAV